MKNRKKNSDFCWIKIRFCSKFSSAFNQFLNFEEKKLDCISKNEQCSGVFVFQIFFCVILSFWVTVDFVFYLCSIQLGLGLSSSTLLTWIFGRIILLRAKKKTIWLVDQQRKTQNILLNHFIMRRKKCRYIVNLKVIDLVDLTMRMKTQLFVE